MPRSATTSRSSRSGTSPLLVVFLALVLLPSYATAFFEQFFQQQHAQQQAPQRPPSWDEQLESVPCHDYVCPDLSCAPTPADCPCPSRMDEKCILPDATGTGHEAYVCTRDCSKVSAAMHAFR
ncbi:hypothetical protein BMF94_2655 [Rhodotorula taiwanensis]|uniref:Long chronological lifespan protein 2 n=1 Tax=Rhodotorula taiwanensis TaxID=741276 RepID=A0A2S5BBS9_9BASI|nr:hypothetical protein BMF94_2655 [Rhodotorula taiwanensis]